MCAGYVKIYIDLLGEIVTPNDANCSNVYTIVCLSEYLFMLY